MHGCTHAVKKLYDVFQASRSYIGFCPDPKQHYIEKTEQSIVKFTEKMMIMPENTYRILKRNKIYINSHTIPNFFEAET